MKNHLQLATILGGLTILTAALFAQIPPPAGSPATSGVAPALVNPPVTPAVPSVVPPAPVNGANPALVNPPVTPALPPVATPAEPTMPVTPAISPAPVVQAGTAVTPYSNPATPSTTGALDASGRVTSARLSSMDTDGDGKISPAEYSAYLSRTGAASAGLATNPTTPVAKRGFWSRMFHGSDPTPAAGASVSANPRFVDLDSNHDGYLSQAEIDAGGTWKR